MAAIGRMARSNSHCEETQSTTQSVIASLRSQ